MFLFWHQILPKQSIPKATVRSSMPDSLGIFCGTAMALVSSCKQLMEQVNQLILIIGGQNPPRKWEAKKIKMMTVSV